MNPFAFKEMIDKPLDDYDIDCIAYHLKYCGETFELRKLLLSLSDYDLYRIKLAMFYI